MRGTIKAKVKDSDGETNEKGEPIADVSSWGDPVDCLYFANVYNNRGVYQDGVFTKSEFNITITDLSFIATEVQLTDNRENVICEKQVQRLELLENVQRIKITI